MSGSVTFYNKNGQRFQNGEIECTYSRSWRLNGAGVAKITVPISEGKLTAELAAYGGFVVIEDDRAGTWAGMLWQPYSETEDTVEFTAYTPEKILAQRRVTPGTITGSAGAMFESLIAIANQNEATLITVGVIDSSGLSWTETLANEYVFDVVARLANKSNQYWSIDPAIGDDGLLTFTANWYTRRGTDYAIRLEEGQHFARPAGLAWVEDGDVVNDVLVYGNSSSAASAITARQVDAVSQATYGLRQGSFGIDSDDASTLNAAAAAILQARAYPRRDHRMLLLDVYMDSTQTTRAFDYTREGDTFIMVRPRHGYSTFGHGGYEARVQVLAREYDATEGRMALTVREVF